jgi:hypothetical protein
MTVKPLVEDLPKATMDYYNKKAAAAGGGVRGNVTAALQTAGGFLPGSGALATFAGSAMAHADDPKQMLKDAAMDPEHPLAQIAKGLVDSHIETGKKAAASLNDTLDAVKNGNLQLAQENLSRAQGYGLATVVPIVGPAAAKIGEDVTENPEYAAGEATGLIGSVLAPGLVKKGVGRIAGKLSPTTATIAETEVPVPSKAAATVGQVAGREGLQALSEQTQAAGREAVGKIASKEATATARSVADELPGAPKPTQVRVADFGEAADVSKAAAKPVYDRLNGLSDGKFEELQNQYRDARKALANGNDVLEARKLMGEAQTGMQEIADAHPNEVSPDAFSKANEAYRRGIARENLNEAIQRATKGTPEDVPAVEMDNGEQLPQKPLETLGARIREQLKTLERNGDLSDAVSKPHRDALFQLADALDYAAPTKVNSLLRGLWRLTKGGGVLGTIAAGHPGAAALLGAAAVGEFAADKVLSRVMADPKAAASLANGLRSGASNAVIVNQVSRSLKPDALSGEKE